MGRGLFKAKETTSTKKRNSKCFSDARLILKDVLLYCAGGTRSSIARANAALRCNVI